MASRVSNIGFNCDNAFELSEWWKSVVGYSDVPGDPNEAGDEDCMIVDLDTGHGSCSPRSTSSRTPRVGSILILRPSIGAATRKSSEFSDWVPQKWPTAATPMGPAGWSWPIQPATSSASFAATRNVTRLDRCRVQRSRALHLRSSWVGRVILVRLTRRSMVHACGAGVAEHKDAPRPEHP